MRKIVLAGIFALSASTSLAQTSVAPAPAAPAAPAAESAVPAAPAPTDPAAAPQAAAGGPANLCQELLAFMKAPPPEAPASAAKPAAAPAKQEAPAQAAPAGQAAPAQQAAPAGQGSSAMAGTTSSGEGASAKPEKEATSAQAITGQDGVATDAPAPSKNSQAAAGSVANAPQKESRAAPMPPADVTSTPKESVMTVEKAEELATANDIGVCQNTARQMRVAGVAMPPPLIALAALDLQYQQGAGTTAPAGAAEPAATGQQPAPQAPAPQ